MTISCIIIDDEPLALKGLTEYIQSIGYLHLFGAYDDALKASASIDLNKVDMVFLDIELPRISGIDFLKSLQNKPFIIFTTAYPQFALEGFELNAIDYLVKPISFPRFLKAVEKMKDQLKLKNQNEMFTPAPQDEYIFIKADNKLIKIFISDVLFIEALQNYVAVYTSEKKYIAYLTFKAVEEKLPGNKFLKVHKSYVVQIAKVDAIENNEIIISSNRIPVSRNLKKKF